MAAIVADTAADLEVHMVADMEVDKVADKVADIVADMVRHGDCFNFAKMGDVWVMLFLFRH